MASVSSLLTLWLKKRQTNFTALAEIALLYASAGKWRTGDVLREAGKTLSSQGWPSCRIWDGRRCDQAYPAPAW